MGYWEIFDHVSTLTSQHLSHVPMLTYLAELMRWCCTRARCILASPLQPCSQHTSPSTKTCWRIFSSYTRNWKIYLRESWPACKSIFCLVLSKDFDSKFCQVFVGVTFCIAFLNVSLRSGWPSHPHSQEKVYTFGCSWASPWSSGGTALPSSKTPTACGRGQKWAAAKANAQV